MINKKTKNKILLLNIYRILSRILINENTFLVNIEILLH